MEPNKNKSGKNRCVINDARDELIGLWSGSNPGEARKLLARGAGVLTRITHGQELQRPVKVLEDLVFSLKKSPSSSCFAAASLIEELLNHHKDLLFSHISDKECSAGICFFCFQENIPPCQRACPAGIDIPGFMTQTGRGEFQDAVEIISENNPFPYVCGMICPAPCEDACLRNLFDEPVFIRPLKAVAAKGAANSKGYPEPYTAPLTGKKVAVIGAGPAGLSASFYLAKKGHEPVVFESEDEPGGMLRYGIPEFRLSREILNSDISWITSHGVKIHTKERKKEIGKLFKEGFDAVFLATGVHLSRKIPFKGNDLAHVLSGVDFLKKVNKGENPVVGPDVVVVGGGNVAVDVAMAALRQGGKNVHMVCLENRDEMPASFHELRAATMEGVVVHNSWGPFEAKKDHTFESIFCKRVFDENQRFAPVFDDTRHMTLKADHLIIAAGQAADLSYLETENEIDTTTGLIWVDKYSHATDREGVFAGGDVVTGPNIAVEAVKAGKEAAIAIDEWLQQQQDKSESLSRSSLSPVSHPLLPNTQAGFSNTKPRLSNFYTRHLSHSTGSTHSANFADSTGFTDSSQPLRVTATHRMEEKRAVLLEQNPDVRKKNFFPVEFELDPEIAAAEAGRCLRCDICIGCGLCQFVCSEMGVDAIKLVKSGTGRFVISDFKNISDKCISCGACGEVCPTGAITLVQEELLKRTEFTGTVMCENILLKCSKCGTPLMPGKYYDFMENNYCSKSGCNESLRLCYSCTRQESADKEKRYFI